MNQSRSLPSAHDALGVAIAELPIQSFAPLQISPWLAMSVLQKAIRRGEEQVALRAAARLLQISPPRLWRRCAAIAFEDVGVADLETISLVVAAVRSKSDRSKLGGEWRVASSIVSRMVKAQKCRSADDLLISADQHPDFAQARRELATKPIGVLCEKMASADHIVERAIALWYAVGTNRWSAPHLVPRIGQRDRAFDHLAELGVPRDLVAVCQDGFRRTGEALAPFVALLSLAQDRPSSRSRNLVSDELPPTTICGDVPSWAFDAYSREGRTALKAYISGDSPTARWVRQRIPAGRRINFVGAILFRVEGGLVRSRVRWAGADELRRLADVECQGVPLHEAEEILRLMSIDIPALNEARCGVL